MFPDPLASSGTWWSTTTNANFTKDDISGRTRTADTYTAYIDWGKWGTCPWEVDPDGTLRVSPGVTGAIGPNATLVPWHGVREYIRKALFIADDTGYVVGDQDSRYLFEGCSNLVEADLSGFYTSSVQFMTSMFEGCSSLTSLDVAGWVTSSVTSMSFMFNLCSSLESLDLSGWDTSSVTVEIHTFSGCSSLASITVGSNYVIKTTAMFPEANADDGWWSVSEHKWFTKADIVSDRSKTADTYTKWEHAPSFKKLSLVLDGRIGVNFYCDLSMLTDSERKKTYMEFDLRGSKTITDKFDATHTNLSDNFYGFTCPVNVAQMAEPIKATLHWPGGSDTMTCSVQDYVDSALDTESGFPENARSLVKAIADYGHYMQPFLATNRGWKVGKDYNAMPYETALGDNEVVVATNAVKDGYAFTVSDLEGTGIDIVTYSLLLDSETGINVYLKPGDDFSGTVTASCGGKVLDVTQPTGDGRYRVELRNIPAHRLGERFEITVNAAKSFTVKVSPMSYVRTMLTSTSAVFNNEECHFAAAALYRYWAAATAYYSITHS